MGEMDVLSLGAILQTGTRGAGWVHRATHAELQDWDSSWASDLPDLKLKPKNLCPPSLWDQLTFSIKMEI